LRYSRELQKALDFTSEDNVNDKTVERLLKEKSKKLETENILLKVCIYSFTHTEHELMHNVKTNIANMESKLAQVTEQLSKSEETVSELKGLVAKLEDDIARECSSASLNKSIEDMMMEPMHKSPASSSLNSGSASARVEEGSMLRIVCKQRDRFKLTILQLEAVNIYILYLYLQLNAIDRRTKS
jgi:hypothetical protein